MSSVKKVLIVGGGIGGLSLGIALRRAGIDAEIVELQKEFNVLKLIDGYRTRGHLFTKTTGTG